MYAYLEDPEPSWSSFLGSLGLRIQDFRVEGLLWNYSNPRPARHKKSKKTNYAGALGEGVGFKGVPLRMSMSTAKHKRLTVQP